ncbi:hypothetical protein CRYUN_Cryun20dG0066100 [Craigia yunnanensis]
MVDAQDIDGKPCEENLPCTSQKRETRNEMLSRHIKKEISQLQNKEIELKKAAVKGSKAGQKTKKKQVEEEISRLSIKLKEKNAKELASLGYSNSNGNDKSNIDDLVKAIARVFITPQLDHPKLSQENTIDGDFDDSLVGRFENYCKEVESLHKEDN